MKLGLKKIVLAAIFFSITLPAFGQVDMKILEYGGYASLDTLSINIHENDNTGVGGQYLTVYFKIYNLSVTNAVAFYVEAEWLCSNSSTFYQFCQQYPPTYTSGTCHTFHREGLKIYNNHTDINPDTCNYNYLKGYFSVYDYSVEDEHEKVGKFTVRKTITNEVLDSMYFIVRRGNLPCYLSQPDTSGSTNIQAISTDDIAVIYPNPVNNFFTIQDKQGQLFACSLYSPEGKLILNKQVENREKSEINVANLSNGIYYLRLTDKKGKSFYKKIVVDH